MKMKRILVLLLGVLMLLSLCACGQSAQSAKDASGLSDYAYRAASPEMPMPAPMEEAADWAEADEIGGFAAAGAANYDEAEAVQTPDINPEKIIYSADATVETTEFEQTLEKLEALVRQFGGFIESSSVNGSNYYSQSRGYAGDRSAHYTIRIPCERFQELMGSLSTLGNVPYTYTYTENITSQYYDVQARLTAYETQETRLLEMMELAETVSDLIEIESRLGELRYQIESLQSTLNNWDRRVSYSTVTVNVNEVTVFTPEAKLTYGQRLGLAIRNGLQSTGDFFADFLLWFLEALPALLILAALTVVTVVLIRRGNKKRRAKKAAGAVVASEPPGVEPKP